MILSGLGLTVGPKTLTGLLRGQLLLSRTLHSMDYALTILAFFGTMPANELLAAEFGRRWLRLSSRLRMLESVPYRQNKIKSFFSDAKFKLFLECRDDQC